MRDVAVVGVAMTRFAKQPERSLKELTAEAVLGAVQNAGASIELIEAAYFANSIAGLITGQEMIRGQVALRPLGVAAIPVINVENACASASTAFHLAWLAVASGKSDLVLAIGAEKMTHPDRTRTFSALGTAVDVESDRMVSAPGSAVRAPDSGALTKSPAMDNYSALARAYMERSGATVEDFAEVVRKAQNNGALNPMAQYGGDHSIGEILASRMISSPLTLLMCSPVTDGAAAAILASSNVADKLAARPIWVKASVVVSGSPGRHFDDDAATRATRKAYERAGITADQVSLAEIHDGAAPAELMAYESLGLVESSKGPDLLRSGETWIGGRIPVNPSGGLLARGHPIGATGLAQIYEAVVQLRGEAGPRQVAGARFAITQNGGGWLEGDVAAEAVHIFAAEP